MRKADVTRLVAALPFDRKAFWVAAGSAMCLYGFREETGDVDLGCTSCLADELEQKGFPSTLMPDGSRRFAYNSDIEIYENFLFDKAEMLDDIPVISIKGLLEMKRFLGRAKDLADIALIERKLEEGKS